MTDASQRKGGGAKTSRSETVTVRFDPKLRYLTELAARVQRRTLSSYIEHAVAESLKNIRLRPDDGDETVHSNGALLWQVDEVHRLARLKQLHPHLLTFEEERLLQLLHEATLHLGKGQRLSEERQAELLEPHLALLKRAAAEGSSFADIRSQLAWTNEAIAAQIARNEKENEELRAKMTAAPPRPAKKAK